MTDALAWPRAVHRGPWLAGGLFVSSRASRQCGYLLIDLVHRDADHLVDEMLTGFGRVALWAMEVAGDDERVLGGLRRMGDLLAEVLSQPDGHGALGVLLRYILATHERIDRNRLKRALVETIDARAGESVVTVYEQLIEQGRKKGRAEGHAEGHAEGRATMLLELLAAKFGPVPAEVKGRVEKAGADQLVAWGRRVLTAATLEEALPPSSAPRPSRRAARKSG